MEVYKVAVIEDLKDDSDYLIKSIEKYQKEKGDISFDINLFTNAEQFLNPSTSNFDILFIDIELPGMNGVELAQKIRSKNQSVVIVFVTTMRKYVIKGYEVDAINYILKPYDYGSIKYTLDKCIKNIMLNPQDTYVAKIDGAMKVFNTNNIYFFAIMKHDLLISTTSGDFVTYGNLTTVEKSLNKKVFARISSSIIVNLKHVQQVKGNYVKINNQELLIGRSKKKEFINAFLEYHS